MSLPFTSLDGVTSAGAGTVRDLEEPRVNHTAIVTLTGSPSGFECYLEGSHDNVSWLRLGSFASTAVSALTVNTHYVRYVRANLVSLSGGSSPTVTVTVASA